VKIDGVFTIKRQDGRTTRVATMTLDGPCPVETDRLRRTRDGAVFEVRGVERFLVLGPHGNGKLPRPGETGSLVLELVEGSEPIDVGDEVERIGVSRNDDPPCKAHGAPGYCPLTKETRAR
jgi:hypothetical protein